MEFEKCEEHRIYEVAINFDEFLEILITEEHKNPDTVCDEEASDYGYALCNQCEMLIQVE